jgi:small subunit ribosomal protein S18
VAGKNTRTRRANPPPAHSRRKANPLRAAGVTTVDYKDIHLLRAFISERGKIRSRSVTGLTRAEQRQVAQAIKNAREMALLPYVGQERRSGQ